MGGFEFANSLNWNLVTRLDLQARQVPNEPDWYNPIPYKSVTVNHRILMIGCKSNSAKPNWWLGCRAKKLLFISPSSTSQFPAAAYTQQKLCPLNTLTLIKFDNDGLFPYLLIIDVPPWHKDLYVEVWSYDGPDEE